MLSMVNDHLPAVLRVLRGMRGLLRPPPRTRDAVVSFQDACVRDLIRHAYARVPYYRRLFERAGLEPVDVRGVADLAAVPLTSREDLQHLPPSEICAMRAPVDALYTVTTSGSTGVPLTVRRSMAEERLLLAYRVRAMGAWGLGPGARRARIDHLHPGRQGPDAARRWLHGRHGAMPRLWIDWRTPKHEILAALERFQPHIVNGPPSILSWLADELTDDDRRRIPAHLIVTGSETLTPRMRGQIERGFGLPVADVYGSHEVVFIAMQVPQPGADAPLYRVCEESVAIEVLRDGSPARPGETGEVVVTALQSFMMPFIRYRLGDHVTLGEAPGGSAGPYTTLRSVNGRTLERFILPKGRTVLCYLLGEAVEESGLRVRRFQVVQERPEAFHIALALYEPPRGELEWTGGSAPGHPRAGGHGVHRHRAGAHRKGPREVLAVRPLRAPHRGGQDQRARPAVTPICGYGESGKLIMVEGVESRLHNR